MLLLEACGFARELRRVMNPGKSANLVYVVPRVHLVKARRPSSEAMPRYGVQLRMREYHGGIFHSDYRE